MPSHIAGATAGSASTFAGSAASGTEPKWWASSGAVASVAATVIATPSASARTSRAAQAGASSAAAAPRARPSGAPSRRMPATAANESCQPGSAALRGFQASVATAASSSA